MWTTGRCGGDRRRCSQSDKEEFELEGGESEWGQSFLVQNLYFIALSFGYGLTGMFEYRGRSKMDGERENCAELGGSCKRNCGQELKVNCLFTTYVEVVHRDLCG